MGDKVSPAANNSLFLFHRGNSLVKLQQLKSTFFKASWESVVFWGVLLLYGPLALWARFHFLDNALLEPHPWRQTQTALTITQLFQGTATVWDYRSPLGGMLWNNVYEFPIYQWVVSHVMSLGIGLEVASRLVTLISFGVGSFFAYLLVKEFFDQRIANWFLLFYWVNPFGVIFSRVCLIDFFALAGTLASIYGVVRLRAGGKSFFYWLFFALGGTMASLAKINIWFFITAGILGVVLLEYIFKKETRKKWQWGILAILMVQVSLVLMWNYHRVHDLHSPADTPWLLGEWSQRLDGWRWKKIMWLFGVRSMFYDWLWIPFLLGVPVLFKRSKILFVIIFGVFITHTLVFFQVQSFHDYYLIACLPYLFTVTALGMTSLFENPSIIKKVGTVLLLMLIVFKATQLMFYYSPIVHDYRPDLASIFKLKENTDPRDIIYWNAKQGSWEIPTYSEREVGLSETATLIGKKSPFTEEVYLPTVYHFESEKLDLELLKNLGQVWLDGTLDFPLYRTEAVGKFTFFPLKQWAVLTEAPKGSTVVSWREEVDVCKMSKALAVKIPIGIKEVQVFSADGHLVVRFPGNKAILNIPPFENWGCRLKIKTIS